MVYSFNFLAQPHLWTDSARRKWRGTVQRACVHHVSEVWEALGQLLYSVPTWVLVPLVIAVTTSLVVTAVLLVRRAVPLFVLESNNDYQDLAVGTLGVFYAVLVAFVVFIVWDEYRDTRDIVEGEANKLGDLVRNASGYDGPFRLAVQSGVRDYADAVVQEWETVSRGGQDPRASAAIDKLWAVYVSHVPTDEREKALFSEGLSRLSELREQRRLRLLRVETSVPGLLWFVLLTGEVLTVGSTLFFGLKSVRTQAVLTSMVAVMISLSLLVIAAFDHPFIGDVRVNSHAFVEQIAEADRFMRQ